MALTGLISLQHLMADLAMIAIAVLVCPLRHVEDDTVREHIPCAAITVKDFLVLHYSYFHFEPVHVEHAKLCLCSFQSPIKQCSFLCYTAHY